LKEEWVRRAIANVAKDLIDNRHVASDCGPLYHGMHALTVYRQRTVPGYLVPQFNSQIKLAERGKNRVATEELSRKSKKSAPAEKLTEKVSEKVPEKVADKVAEKASGKSVDSAGIKSTNGPTVRIVPKTGETATEKTTSAKPAEKAATDSTANSLPVNNVPVNNLPADSAAGEPVTSSLADANASTKADTDTTKK